MGDPNVLYYGDNLEILRHHLADESVDLIYYLDPPFNSDVLFAENDETEDHAHIEAFGETWTWGIEAAQEYAQVLRGGDDPTLLRLHVRRVQK